MTAEFPCCAADSRQVSRRLWTVAWIVAAAACLLRIAFASQRGLWLDEYFTLHAARLSLPEMIKDRIQAGHSPLYFFYARLGLLLGASERGLRVTSALAAGAAVLALTGLLGELKLTRCLPALWLVAVVEPYWMSVGMEYRYTMPLIAVAAATAWLAVRYTARPDARRGVHLMLATGLLLWMHGSTPFFAIGLLVFLLWDQLGDAPAGAARLAGRLGSALRRTWPVLAGIALGVPFFILVRKHESITAAQTAHFKDLLNDLVDVVFGEHQLWFNFFNWHHHTWLLDLERVVLAGAIFMTWRELRQRGNARAWRLLASTLVSVPLILYAFCLFVKNFQGPVRYVAAFSIPASLCLAIAASAAPSRRWQLWVFRGGLLVALIFQSSAMTLEHGDRHREAILWLKNNHRGKEPIVTSVTGMNQEAMKFYGMNPKGITVGGFDQDEAMTAVEEKIKKGFTTARRGLYIRYHSRKPILTGIDNLVQKGFFTAQRRWKIGNGRLVVGAVIRDKKDQAWLDALPAPTWEWGPAQADL